MKVQNPTKLDIFFKGGGIIKFPVQNLKQIDVEPIEEGDNDNDIDYSKITWDDVKDDFVKYYFEFTEEQVSPEDIVFPDKLLYTVINYSDFNNIRLESIEEIENIFDFILDDIDLSIASKLLKSKILFVYNSSSENANPNKYYFTQNGIFKGDKLLVNYEKSLSYGNETYYSYDGNNGGD